MEELAHKRRKIQVFGATNAPWSIPRTRRVITAPLIVPWTVNSHPSKIFILFTITFTLGETGRA